MKGLLITDLFGNNIKETINDINIILVHVLAPTRILKKISSTAFGSIYKIDDDILNQHILHIGLSVDNYIPFGHIWIYDDKMCQVTVPYGYKKCKFIRPTTNYVAVNKLNNGMLWKPLTNNENFNSLGLIYSDKYPTEETALIDNSMLISYFGSIKKNSMLSTINEFDLLNLVTPKNMTLNRIIFIFNGTNAWLYNNYYSKILDYNLKLTTNRKLENKMQHHKNGLLEINNKYLTFNKTIKLTNKENASTWYQYYDSNGMLYILNGTNKCLTYENDKLELKNIKSNSNGKYWYHENDIESVIDNTEYLGSRSWTTEEGHNVNLIVPNDPWFINRESQLDPELIFTNKQNEKIIIEQPKLEHISNKQSTDYGISFISFIIFIIFFILLSYYSMNYIKY